MSEITPETAHNFLMREVYVPVFLEKLANDFGVVPQTEEEVANLLKIAGHLTSIQEQETVKQAQARSSLIDAASTNLENAMSKMGYASPEARQVADQEEALVKAAAANLATNPAVQAAVATYHDALVQHLANS
jgi:DNA-binding transcriptional regulator YhcF (GntR family)